MRNAATVLDLYAERLRDQRHAANESFHARLRGLLVAAGRRDAAYRLERARAAARWSDIAADPLYIQAVRAARSALPRSERVKAPPLPRPPITAAEFVHRKAWGLFSTCAAALGRAWGVSRRMLLLTVTVSSDADRSWKGRMRWVTARRDRVLRRLKKHKVWSVTFFDVQGKDDPSSDLNPHYHILFVTEADRVQDVTKILGGSRVVHVAHCDHEKGKSTGALLSERDRQRSWLRSLVYCSKIWPPRGCVVLMNEWQRILTALMKEAGYKTRTKNGALAARAAHRVYRCKTRFHLIDIKRKALRPYRPYRPRTAKRVAAGVRGRPRLRLNPAIMTAVAAGSMPFSEAARRLGVHVKTVRRHASARQA